MIVPTSTKLTLSVILYSLTINSCVSEVSPYSPPFLRAVGNSASSPNFNFPQQPPASSGSLIQDNSLYSMKYGGASAAAGNSEADTPNLIPQDHYQPAFPSSGSETIHSDNIAMPSAFSLPNNGVPFPPGSYNEVDSMYGNDNGAANSMTVNNVRVNRPQLRQLDFVASRSNPNPPIPVARTNARSEDNRRPVQPRSPSQPSSRNGNTRRVSEGHRLITRALWRIFDALMERNEKAELTERMIQVENTVGNLKVPDTNSLESMVEMLKEENLGQDQRLLELSRRLEEIPLLQERLEKLENWQLTFGQNDEELPSIIWDNKPAYTSCPAPFETVEGECFYIGGAAKRSWHDARRDCSKHGADLASPRQLSSLQSYLQSLAYQPEYVWVGASRQGNGEWVWSAGPQEGILVDRSSKTWNDDLPSGVGNCMGLYEGSSYRAYDYSCEEQDLYVCQFFL